MKRTLSSSLDSSTIGSPLNLPKCVTSLSNSKPFVAFSASSTFSGSLLSPSSSEMSVSSQHVTTYNSSSMTSNNSYTSLPTSTLNSPSAVFSSCMFPEIPAFSPGDFALSGCGTDHASGPAYNAVEEAELTAGGVNEGGIGAENSDEGSESMRSTSLKRSLSETFSDDDVTGPHPSKRKCSDVSQQHPQRSPGLITS